MTRAGASVICTNFSAFSYLLLREYEEDKFEATRQEDSTRLNLYMLDTQTFLKEIQQQVRARMV